MFSVITQTSMLLFGGVRLSNAICTSVQQFVRRTKGIVCIHCKKHIFSISISLLASFISLFRFKRLLIRVPPSIIHL